MKQEKTKPEKIDIRLMALNAMNTCCRSTHQENAIRSIQPTLKQRIMRGWEK